MTAITLYVEKIKEAKERLEKNHLAGAGGMETCLAWSGFVDNLITELFDSVAGAEKNAPVALVALGGYGRRELNPCSDIDLLFLYENSISHSDESVYTGIIPTLWDIGFKVGHSTRTIADCLKISDSDQVSKTSMMEARFLSGNRQMFDLFAYRFKTKVVRKKINLFIREKRVETELRHKKFSNTLFLTEPNLKESPGGLRDYHLALWMASARYGVKTIPEIKERGLIQSEEAKRVTDSLDFILKVRNDLHFLTKKPQDLLDYGLQTAVAKRLGYGGDTHESVVNMMREYYRAGDAVYKFGRSLTEQAVRYRTRAQLFLLKFRHKEILPGVFIGPEEIYVKGLTTRQLSEAPERLFEILRIIAEKELKPSPGLRGMLEKIGSGWKKKTPENPERVGEGFRSILSAEEPAEVMRLMRDSKLVTAVIPEFYAIRYLTPFDLYHKFTVDDHSFIAIREMDNLKRNDDPDCNVLRLLYEEEKRKDILRLTILLHDLDKGDGGSHHDEPDIDPKIVERLGYSAKDAQAVRTLIRLHLLMSEISQRRDTHDMKTVTEFCEKVGDETTLKRLYLLTFADMSAVGPGVWNSWRATLLRELFAKSMGYFKGEDILRKTSPGKFLSNDELTDDVIKFVKGMPERYFQISSPKKVVKDAALFEKYSAGKSLALANHRAASDAEPGELTIMTKDKAGLLQLLVGTLASRNVDILDSQILTHKDGITVDIFRVNGPDGKPINDEQFWIRMENEIEKIISAEKTVEELMRNRQKLMVTAQNLPTVFPMVKLLNDVSADYTIIETTARDRMGLLYDITRTLGNAKVRIVSARISTEGHKAMNVFYVTQQQGGGKITDHEKIFVIKRELASVL